jgi:hypothetical protein
MSFKNRLGLILVVLGFVTLPFARFGGEFLLISAFLLAFGVTRIAKDLGVRDKVRDIIWSSRHQSESQLRERPRIDPLLPVRVLKLAEARSGVVTVSSVAMALNVGLDECQLALDELVRKGAANVDVDLSTGVSSYSFPEFLPHRVEDGGAL